MKKRVSLLLLLAIAVQLIAEAANRPPNIILIFCDDLGYSDVSCYGSLWNQTPEIDRMATEGLRFTDFYAGAPVCSPSRAGLMTGCYARRVDLDLDEHDQWVLFPASHKGINPAETILPEMLQQRGYATAIIGKWHLGDQPVFFPTNNGFNYWFGIPYSNDMGIKKGEQHLLPIIENDKIVDQIDQRSQEQMSLLTKRYTEKAIQWIGQHKKRPFFLYLAHNMPHYPVAARPEFLSKTGNPKKAYGGSIAEISWSTGSILQYLKKQGLDRNTMVIFTSDNGGVLGMGASNGILRAAKGQIYDGGIRVPCIVWWPGKVPAGSTCYAQASVLDFYSSFATLAGKPLSDNVRRDGTDISDYFFHPDKQREPRPFYYWHVGYLQALRYGNWKLNLLSQFSEEARQHILKSTYKIVHFTDHIELYNLQNDPGELKDVSQMHPEIVQQLLQLAQDARADLGEFDQKGPGVRKTLYVDNPKPNLK